MTPAEKARELRAQYERRRAQTALKTAQPALSRAIAQWITGARSQATLASTIKDQIEKVTKLQVTVLER